MILKEVKQNGMEILAVTFVLIALMSVSMFLPLTARFISVPANGTPLFNTIYNLLFGGNVSIGTQVISLFFLFVEVFLVVVMNNKFELTRAKSTIFVLIYMVLALSYIPISTFLPEQIANIFVILGFYKILSSHGKDDATFHFFDGGFFFGLAALFCLPATVLLIIGLLAYVIFRPYPFREFAVYIIGFLTPMFFYVSLYYIFEDTLQPLADYYVQKFSVGLNFKVTHNELICFGTHLLLVLIASVIISQEYPKYNLFESRTYRLFFILFLLILIITLTPFFGIQTFKMLLMPVTMLYVTVFFNMKQGLFSEIFFAIFILSNIGMQILWYMM